MSAFRADRDVADERANLTPRHLALIEAIAGAASRGNTISRELAGTAAGYAPGESARVAASRALALPHVRAALTKRLREMAQVDAASSLAVLRHLEMNAESERVRLDAALAGMRLGGLDASDQGQTGAAVAVQIVFRTDAGTVLTQAQHMPAQPQAISHFREVEHSLAEGDASPEPSQAGGEGAMPDAPKRGGGSKTSARRSPPGLPHNSPPKKPRVKKKLARKVARKAAAKGNPKARVVSAPINSAGSTAAVSKALKDAPVRRLNLSDAERLRRSEAAKARNAARAAAKAGADG